MPRGPKGERRPADVIGKAVHVMRIAIGEIKDKVPFARSAAPPPTPYNIQYLQTKQTKMGHLLEPLKCWANSRSIADLLGPETFRA
jgi:hypothetical protein